jgi:Inner membrane component of T3SS, cytoplasmic domain/Transcription elongation factor, GreA/GreB, C-term
MTPLVSRIYFNAVYGALGGLLGWLLFGVFGEKNPSRDPAFLPAEIRVKDLSQDKERTFVLVAAGEENAASDRILTTSATAAVLMGKKVGDEVDVIEPTQLVRVKILGTYFLTREHINWLIGGLLIGGLIGYFVVSVEAIRDRSLVRFARLASYGVVLGLLGGAVGMLIAENLNYFLVDILGGSFVVGVLARGLAWSLLGLAIGMSEGIAARSVGKFSYGALGGAIGGFIGGCLFMVFYDASVRFGSALGLVIMGACIGSLSALVQAVFQPACVKVLRGWQEGREYPLDKLASLLGRDEHADIALFRDMKVEKQHAYIRRVDARYLLINNGAPAEFTLVNDVPVPQTRDLRDGDRIQLGNVLLRFQLRSASAKEMGRRSVKS